MHLRDADAGRDLVLAQLLEVAQLEDAALAVRQRRQQVLDREAGLDAGEPPVVAGQGVAERAPPSRSVGVLRELGRYAARASRASSRTSSPTPSASASSFTVGARWSWLLSVSVAAVIRVESSLAARGTLVAHEWLSLIHI